MMLFLASIDLKPGDVVLANGSWRDKTVNSIERLDGNCVLVNWTCGSSTRYRWDFEHKVAREGFNG